MSFSDNTRPGRQIDLSRSHSHVFLFSECKCPSYNWRRLEDPPWSLLMGPLWLLGVNAQPYRPLSPPHHHSLPQPASNVTLWSAWPSLLLHNTTPLPLLLKIRFGEGKLWRTRCATPEKGSGPHRSSPWVKQERRIVSWHFCLKVNLTVCTATCFLFTDSCDFYWNWCS